MMRGVYAVAAVALLAFAPAAAAAPKVHLTIGDGRVSLVATDATVAEILAEWARVGHTRMLNAEQVAGGPVTLEFHDLPEQQALDVLLRSAGGFMAVPRPIATSTESRFDRVLILPTSTPPPDSPARAVAVPAFPQQTLPQIAAPVVAPQVTGVQRIIGPDGLPVPDDQDDAPGQAPAPPTFMPNRPPGQPPRPRSVRQ